MNKKHFFIAFLSLLAFNLFSQENTKTEETPIEELTVTANRFAQKLSETAKNVTIISQEELERSKGLSVAQLLQNQAGIAIAGANNNQGTALSVYTRGASYGQTLILLNGMPINDPSKISMEFDLSLIQADQLSKIEIVKNAQSTLYGSDAVAGVINLITAKNTAEKLFSPSVTLQGGSFGSTKGSFGLDVNRDGFYSNILVNYNQTNGISDAAKSLLSSNSEANEKDASTGSNVMINAGKNYTNGQLRFNAILGGIKGNLDEGAFNDEKDYTFTSQMGTFGIGGTRNFKRFSINANVKMDLTNRVYENDSTFVDTGAWSKYSKNIYKSNVVFGEVFSKINMNKNIDLLVGFDSRLQKSEQEDNYDNFITQLDSINTSLSSIYAMLYVKNEKGFFAELGGRTNFHSLYGNNSTFNISPSYSVNENFRVFANVSSGFKTPSLYQLYSIYGNKDLKPEESLSSELGLQFKKGAVNMKAAFFTSNIKNLMFFSFDPVTFAAKYINQDKQKYQGCEVEANYTVKKFNISANYTYVTGEITTKTGSRDTVYNNLFRRAKNSINLGVGYAINENIFVKVNARSVGKRYDLFFDDVTFTSNKIELSAYTLLDFYGEYTFSKKYKAFLQLNNILNEKYYDIYGFNTRPVNFMVGVNAKF